MEALSVSQVDYQALIQQKLAFIPADYLAHLYQIVSLMAMPFEPVAEPIPEPTVTLAELEQYTQEVRDAFGFYFSDLYKLNVSYHIGKELTYMAYQVVSVENFSSDLQPSDKSIEVYLIESNIDKQIIDEAIQISQKAKLYEEDTFWIIRPSHSENWTTEKAKEDAREEIGAMLQKLPSYAHNTITQYATYFKQAIKTVLPTGMNVAISYQIVDNELVLIEVTPTEEASSEKIASVALDVDLLFAENETTKEYVLQNIEKQTILLFSEDSIVLCKQHLPAQWTQENAQSDVRAVVGTLISHLPTYEEA